VRLQIELRVVQVHLAAAVNEAAKSAGITPNMHIALNAISRFPGIRPSALADMQVTPASNVSRIAKALEKQGLISRKAMPGDGRAVRMYVHERGERLMQEIEQRSAAGIGRCFVVLNAEEQEVFCRIVGKLSDVYMNYEY
jgi:DNA-binding MarR family transcriptional regulator